MLLLPAILQSYQSKVDKTFKVVFSTNELTPEQAAVLSASIMQFGYLAFKVEPFKKEEKEAIESLESDYEDGSKTPSQRLRAVLFVNFKNNSEGFDSFVRYYDHHLEKIIDHYKKKLP